MKYEIKPDHLLFTVDAEEQKQLQGLHDEDPEAFDTDDCMVDLWEHTVCNSELSWVPEGTTGDLTSAPMLGIFKEDLNEDRILTHRWAFMRYQIRSPQRDLLEYGECRWEGGSLVEEEVAADQAEIV